MLNKNFFFPVKLLSIIICFGLICNSGNPYDRLKNGDITGCAFYNSDSYTIIKFKDVNLAYTRWSGIPGGTNEYKIEEYNIAYSYYKQGMGGSINGIPFIILIKTVQNKPVYYLSYKGVSYYFNETYSE
ncbi:hypothetical protein [uncultured Mucilaginibacter sp.]|uniref:hypothetical protein n=1 Tax=uncultured Mucilaginibacter sp. TaxID=797541 RepID=UPI0025FA1807|nr:hypothetical protein [uncultured Mucilaginibacter sp.]